MSSTPENSAPKETVPPAQPNGDGFPPEKDVSAPPPGTDQSDHPDKKEKD